MFELSWKQILYFCVCVIFFCSCTSGPIIDARKDFYAGQSEQAVSALLEEKGISYRDKLLYYMEKGLILHSLGDYQKSTDVLLKASYLIDEQQIISASEQVVSLAINEWMTEYKGEYSEQLWVHTYLMMNFLLLGKYEDALVEAKRASKVLDREGSYLNDDYFTRTLIGLCYELLSEYNDAYIEYKKLSKLMGESSSGAYYACKTASKLGFYDDVEVYKKFLPKCDEQAKEPVSELILFAGYGKISTKIPGNVFIPPTIRFSFPMYPERKLIYNPITVINENGESMDVKTIHANFDKVVRNSLDDRKAKIIVKETARVVAKEAIAHSIDDRDSPLGLLVRLIFMILEEADTRCWETLPAFLTIARIPLEPGNHTIQVMFRGKFGESVYSETIPEFEIKKGQKFFYSMRVK
ncbi:MAG: hypothetical protein HQK76_13250 [Desulfobacterales bacterium]|nr:hypothetical protein [Desulfobacterales bacterium]